MTPAAFEAVRHYLGRALALVELCSSADLVRRPAADMLPVGEQLAIAIGFAGRAILPLAGRAAPDWPEPLDRAGLTRYGADMAEALGAVTPGDLTRRAIVHQAGSADVTQSADDYVMRFALPNMIFHLTAAYVGLKQAGHRLGKADFDAIHAYPDGYSFDEEAGKR